jgi:hypothetical protein
MALSGIPAYQLGVRSPLPFVHAIYLASEGYSVFPSDGDRWIAGSKEAATSDLETLRKWYNGDPNTDWRLRADCRDGQHDGIHAIKFPARRHWEWCVRDMGPLPHTLVIEKDSGHCYHLFARGIADPDFAFGKEIHGSQAKIVRDVPLPGSRDKRSGEVWRWRYGCGIGEVSSLAYLPRSWQLALPKNGNRITAIVTPTHEYRPPTSPLWSKQ